MLKYFIRSAVAMVVRVAVIGAGAAGLAALQHMKTRLDEFEPVAYEQMSVIGGTWVYADNTVDDLGREVPTSMYKNLRTNLPKEVMAFPDFPFPEHLPSFLGHQQVRQYLEDYAEHFELFQFIRFNTEVERVHPQYDSNQRLTWLVRVRDLTKSEDSVTESVFDAVMICNGHHSVPLVPKIPGLQEFTGEVFHSHTYQTPDKYKGRRVLVLGANPSGVDLAVEIASVADKVWLCHRHPPLVTPFPENVVQASGISRLTPDSAILDDGQILKIDVLALCTGYLYSFPFLSPECRCSVTEEQRVVPLYKHLIHTHYTSLSFIGITKIICPFPAFHCQVLFVLAVLSGKLQLPNEEEMEDDTEGEYEWRLSKGFPPTAAHIMGNLQWDYNDELARLAGFEPLPLVVKKLFEYCRLNRSANILKYRENNYRLCSQEEFMHVQ